MTEFEQKLQELLELDERDNGKNKLHVFAKLNEMRRARAHERAKASQPNLGIVDRLGDGHQKIKSALLVALRTPLNEDELDTGQGALEEQLRILYEISESANFEDILHQLVRVYRKIMAGHRYLWPEVGMEPPPPVIPPKPPEPLVQAEPKPVPVIPPRASRRFISPDQQ
jgi:hypothetical protein